MKKTSAVVLLVFVIVFSAFSLSRVRQVLPLLGSEKVTLLKSGEVMTGSTLEGEINHLFPSGSNIALRADAAANESNSFSVAITAFTPYPEDWKDLTQEEKMLRLFNLMTAVSEQKGAMYISRTAGYKPKVLLEESYAVSDPDNSKSKIQDPVFTELPSSYSMYAYQEDNRFGGNIFEIDYTASDCEVFMKITNRTAMKFFGITCVEKGKLSMYLDAYCTSEGIIVSGLATIYDRKPTISVLFYTVDIEESFERRIMGLKDKFIENIME